MLSRHHFLTDMGSPGSCLPTDLDCEPTRLVESHEEISPTNSQNHISSPREKLPMQKKIVNHLSYEDLTDELRGSVNQLCTGIPSLSNHDILSDIADEKHAEKPQVVETKRSWFIFGVCFLFQILFGFDLFAPSVYLVYYVEVFDISVADASWACAIFVFTNFMVGTVASTCVSKFGCRFTTIVGAVVLSLSLAASSLAPSMTMIYLFQGVGAGTGAGFTFIGMNVILPKYFGRNRALASCFVISGIGVGYLVAPIAISLFVNEYGWRGSVLLQTGITLHMLPLALFFVEPPLKKGLSLEIRSNDVERPAKSSEELVALGPDEKETLAAVEDKCEEVFIVSDDATTSGNRGSSGKCGCLKHFFDVDLLRKNPIFVLYCLSNFLCRICSNILVTHLPNFFVTSGYSHSQAAFATSVSGGCNLLGRFVGGGLTAYPRIDLLMVYSGIMLLNIFTPLLLLYVPGYAGKTMAAGIFGFVFGFDYLFVPAILVDLLGVEMLAKSLGLYNILSVAFVILIMPFLAGWMYDISGSYAGAFYLGMTSTAVGSALGFTVSRLQRRKKRD